MAKRETPASAGARQSPKGEARRREILEVAREIFSEGGYHKASLADIAAKVGISQPGLLHHYPSKSDLLLAVLRERNDRDREQIEVDNLGGVDYVNRYLETLQRHDRQPAMLQLNAMISAEALADSHPAHQYFEGFYRENHASMAQSLEEVFDFSRMPAGITGETVAHWIMALSEGLRQQALLDPERVDRTQLIAQFFESMRPYLRDDSPIGPGEPGPIA